MFFYFSLFCVMVCVSLVCQVFMYLCSYVYLVYDFIIIMIMIPTFVHGSSTGECGLLPKYYDHRMKCRCSHLLCLASVFPPAALCQWALKNNDNNNNNITSNILCKLTSSGTSGIQRGNVRIPKLGDQRRPRQRPTCHSTAGSTAAMAVLVGQG